MEWKQKTVDTYNKSAKELAEYFKTIGARTDDIDVAFKLAGNPKNATVLEIGCGDGRDAAEIVRRTSNYVGFDISKELINLARQKVPNAKFEIADAIDYEYSHNDVDVVLAFASLLHLNKDEVQSILKKVHASLKPGGIFFISLKYRPEYTAAPKKDQHGERMFYYYNPSLIEELAGNRYKKVYLDEGFVTGRDTKWFEIALKKK